MTQRKKINLAAFNSDGLKTIVNNTLIKKVLEEDLEDLMCNFKQHRKQKLREKTDVLYFRKTKLAEGIRVKGPT